MPSILSTSSNMATSNSVQLNAATSIPTTKQYIYSAQLQSPLFRLPRELRDEIYEYYAESRQTYEYHKDTDRLRYKDASARAENLGLMATCKAAANEMERVAFQKAEFSTRCSAYDGAEFMSLRSKAARLHCLTNLVQTQRQRMLVCVAELLQDSDFVDIEALYPNMGVYFGGLLPSAAAEQCDRFGLLMPGIWRNDVVNQACIDALLFALNRAHTRSPERFARLTSRVFGPGVCPVGFYRGNLNLFNEASLSELLSWRPDSWWIPQEEDLSRMELLLCKQTDPQPPPLANLELHHRSMSKTRCYFSATAVAINFLYGIPSKQWLNIRKILLYEDRMSMLRPACHTRGLIAFCKSNPALRIERKIGLLNNLLPEASDWGMDDPFVLGSTCLDVVVPWIEETLSLNAHGMPANAYQLTIDGSTREAVEAFEILKYAVAMQEAMLTQAQCNGVQSASWVHDPDCSPISLPWHLPAGLPNAVRQIMNGTSNIQFTGPMGDLWDPDSVFLKRKDWGEADWRDEWKQKIRLNGVKTTFYRDTLAWYEL